MSTRKRLTSYYRRQRSRRMEALKVVGVFVAFAIGTPPLLFLAWAIGSQF